MLVYIIRTLHRINSECILQISILKLCFAGEPIFKSYLFQDSLMESAVSSAASSVSSSPSRDRPPVQQMVRIITNDFPTYFAIISRCRQEAQMVGPNATVLQSMLLPKARVHIPPK